MSYSTGSDIRDSMLRRAIEAYWPDADAVRAALPADFFTPDDPGDEIMAMAADMEAPVTFEEPPNSNLAFDPQSGMTIAPARGSSAQVVPPAVDASKAPTSRKMNYAEAFAEQQAADAHLADCRLAVRQTTAAVQNAKRLLQLEIEKHNAANPNKFTQFDAARQFAAAALEERRKRAARFGTGESAKARAYVMKRMTGGGPHRAAYSEEARARRGFAIPGSVAAAAPFDPQADARARKGLSQPGKPMPSK